MDYDIRKIGVERLGDLIGIFESAFNQAPPLGELQAKHSTEFAGTRDLGYVAYAPDGMPAGYYGVFPLRLRLDGRSVLAAQSGDTMVHKAHEGRRLFTRLARLAYEEARENGVKTVYGFPSATSYPGLVHRLGWTHDGNFRRYLFIAPTLPISELLWRFPLGRALIGRWQRWLLGLFPGGGYFPGSLMESGGDCVERSEGYWRYKVAGPNIRVIKVAGTDTIVKLEGSLGIGDLNTLDARQLRRILRRLRLFCFFAGIARIRTYLSPGAPLDVALGQMATPSEGLPICYVDLVDDDTAANVRYCYFDMDTF